MTLFPPAAMLPGDGGDGLSSIGNSDLMSDRPAGAETDRAPEAAARTAPPADERSVANAISLRIFETSQHLILLVEDNDAIRQLVLTQLTRLGYRLLEANGADAALAILDKGEPVDLLFTDIVMPGSMSGHALAQEAAKRRPGLKALCTSGFPGAVLTDMDGTPGPDAVLSKPCRSKEVAAKLRSSLDA